MKRGVTLMEVVLSTALVAIGLLFIAGIIPTSGFSLKKAENMQSATAYGLELVEDARLKPSPGVATRHYKVTLNHTEMRFKREVLFVEDGLYDVVVTARWTDELPPLRLATRVHRTMGMK